MEKKKITGDWNVNVCAGSYCVSFCVLNNGEGERIPALSCGLVGSSRSNQDSEEPMAKEDCRRIW